MSVFLIFIFLAGSVVGCHQPRPVPSPTVVAVPSPTPVPQGGVLTIRLPQNVEQISPLSSSSFPLPLSLALFSGLFRFNGKLLPQLDLTEKWDQSNDGLVWTFRLRDQVLWHDGLPLTAEDVVYTLNLLRNGAPSTVAQADIQRVVDQVSAPDPRTVRIVLRRRYSPLLADLTLSVLPKHVLQDVQDALNAEVLVGSGPFKFAETKKGQAIYLDANRDFYRGAPNLDQVVFLTTPDDDVAVGALKSGSLLVSEVGYDYRDQLPDEILKHEHAELGFNFVGFNLREGSVFADKQVRLAWKLAIDKKEVVAKATAGRGRTVWSDVPQASWAFDPGFEPGLPDPERAKILLGESGWLPGDDGVRRKGDRTLAVELLVRADAPDRLAAARLIAEQLATVGIAVRVQPADFSTVLAAKRKPPFEFDAILMGWDLSTDPDDYYLFASGQVPDEQNPQLLNFVGFKNAEFDRLSIEARTTTDLNQRKALYGQSQRLLDEELPYYFLWSDKRLVAFNKRVKGVSDPGSPFWFWDLERWFLLERGVT